MRQKSLHLANYKDTIKCILTLFIIPVGFTLLFGWIYSPTYTENTVSYTHLYRWQVQVSPL